MKRAAMRPCSVAPGREQGAGGLPGVPPALGARRDEPGTRAASSMAAARSS